jgi:hypothetical protein
MMERTQIAERFVHQAVVKALVRSRLLYDHPMIALLEQEARVVGATGAPCVQVVDQSGNWIMLEDRIEELKADSRFRASVPNPTRVNRSDEQGVRENFARIAEGSAVVE